ncbi:enoyl-CoA hydratase-related protein [Caulobacter sp. 17J80-11]|uniref:enoyl-CoA hydratase-related protein n=1 Tax=Caulobacter sp. 17J80-11 TaxID=2763502 RepID=UPI001653A3D5|nr:enoyl-CoA hydratase-related protein [Caulobacter sp. 17J80-11]MBC6981996.1 enoyl-CoA hydratase/isomerase family protein [Caulobacter sp. 17J80-11]
MSDFPITDPWVEEPAPDLETTKVLLDASPSGVAFVMINRPQKKNAFDAATIAALREAFETLHGADHVRVVFVRGAEGVFCAGADLEWMRDSADWTEADNRDDALQLARMLKALYDIPALTVALVEKAAMGGGAGLVAACDMAVATRDTKFAFSEVKLGLIPATISPYVVDAIGPRQARALFSTGRVFDAEYARQIGLVTEVVHDSEALNALQERLAGEIMACAPEAIAESKRLVWDVWGRPIDNALMDDTARRIAKKRVSPEGREGVRAFLEKRKPSWIA